MAVETIFSSVLFTEYVLPFLLVFVLVFAILDKTKILGDGKRQINAIISLVIALIFVSFASAVGIVVKLMPFLAVVLVIVLVFYLMMGFIWNEKEGFNPPKFVRVVGAIIAFIALAIAVLVVTGYWSKLLDLFSGQGKAASTVIMIVIVIAAVAAIVWGGKKD